MGLYGKLPACWVEAELMPRGLGVAAEAPGEGPSLELWCIGTSRARPWADVQGVGACLCDEASTPPSAVLGVGCGGRRRPAPSTAGSPNPSGDAAGTCCLELAPEGAGRAAGTPRLQASAGDRDRAGAESRFELGEIHLGATSPSPSNRLCPCPCLLPAPAALVDRSRAGIQPQDRKSCCMAWKSL